MSCTHNKIRFFQEADQVSHESCQTRIFHSKTRNCARKGLVDAKISTEVAAPLQQQRTPRFKIGCTGLRGTGTAISAWAVDQGCLGGPETRIRARKGSGLAEISAIQGITVLEALRRVSSGNRFLRLALQSDFGLGRGWRVFRRSGNTKPRVEKFCPCWNISATRQNNT